MEGRSDWFGSLLTICNLTMDSINIPINKTQALGHGLI